MHIDSGNMILFNRVSKIGKSDVQLILDRVQEIWDIMNRLQGIYKMAPEKTALMKFHTGMKNLLQYAEAASNSVIKTSDDGMSQTMPLDSVQSSPAAQVKFEEEDKKDSMPKIESEKEIDSKELEMGIEVEKEHSDIYNSLKKMFGEDIPWTLEEFTEKIAMGHFKELKDYYTRLKKMEEEGKKDSDN